MFYGHIIGINLDITIRLLKETYRQYSSYNPTGDVWSISSNVITEFA